MIRAPPQLDQDPPSRMRKLIGTFDDGRTTIVIEYSADGESADAFDKAFYKTDLKALVELLSSTDPVDSLEEPKHRWATDPKTVGALSAMHLARLASEVGRSNPGIKDEIRQAGAIPPLVSFLLSCEQDRIQTAVVTLRYLTDECPSAASIAYRAGAMPMLIKCMRSPVGGFRGAASSTVRNIYLANHDYRKAFVDLGGVEELVKHLDTTSEDSVGVADVQYEAICNLEDLIEDEEGNVLKEYAMYAQSRGAIEKLRKLMESEDEEVSQSADKVHAQLQAARVHVNGGYGMVSLSASGSSFACQEAQDGDLGQSVIACGPLYENGQNGTSAGSSALSVY